MGELVRDGELLDVGRALRRRCASRGVTWKVPDRCARRAARRSARWAGPRRPRCGCCRTTSTPRSPSDPTTSSSTAAPAAPRATGAASTRWCARSRTLKGDETMLVQSGRPVGVFQTHEWAPRVLIANSNLVGDWATWPEFRRLEALGLTMYGQMTAGSWIYIGTQGILQGTYETFAAVAERRFGGTLAGHADAHRRLRRDGRRPAARRHDERRRLPVRRRRPGAAAAARRAALPRRVDRRPRRRRSRGSSTAKARRAAR